MSRFARGWVTSAALLVGCGNPAPEARRAAATDAPAVPQRIVSGVVDSDEVLWALGEDVRRRVVGVSPMVDDARYSRVAGVWPTAVPRVAGTSEAMLASNPDLVIIASFSAPETRALLERSGVRSLVLDRFDGFADYRARVTQIARAVGAGPRGVALLAEFDASLPAPVKTTGAPRTVLSYVAGNVAGSGTSFADVARAAGLVNLPGTEGIRGHKAVTVEQIVVWDPDFIVIDCGPDCALAEAKLARSPGFSAMTAVNQGRVVAVPSRRLFSAGAAMAEFATQLADELRADAG